MLKWILYPIGIYGLYKAFKAIAAPTESLLNPFTDSVKRLIFDHFKKRGIPPALALAIIRQESNFDPFARLLEPSFFQRRVKENPKYEYPVKFLNWNETTFGSYGLGQLLLSTAYDLGFRGSPNDLYDIQTNLNLMAELLTVLAKQYAPTGVFDEGAIRNIAAAYNSGQRYDKAPSVTQMEYVPRILKFYNEFNALISKAQGFV